MLRLFVAIRPPAAIRARLLALMGGVRGARWQTDDQLHLTLRFIGEVERPLADDIGHALERIRLDRFKLRIAGVGAFERRHGGALWAAVEPKEPVAALAAKVERACQSAGLAPERRAFHPHITLARFNRQSRPFAKPFLERTCGLASEPFAVDGFILYESRLSRHAAHYEVVARFPLG